MSPTAPRVVAGPPPAVVRLTPGRRVLFLTKDPEQIRRQLAGTLDLTMKDLRVQDLLDDINTDAMTPAWVCFRHRPEDLALDAYAGLIVEGKRLFPTRALLDGGFEVIVSGLRKGVGSSRETAVQAEKWSGIRLAVAASFAPIHARNNVNQGVLMAGHDVLARLQAGEGVPLEEFLEGHDPITQTIVRAGGLFAFNKAFAEGRVKVPATGTPRRPMTIAEKILAAHRQGGDTPFVKPGDSIVCRVDGGYSHEFTTAQVHEFLRQEYGDAYRIKDPSKFAVFEDHVIYADGVPAMAPYGKEIQTLRDMQRAFQRHTGVRDYSARDGVSPGICHQVAREQFVDPGDFIQATDSHTCMGGGNGALAYGVGATEYAALIHSGLTLVKVPESIRFELRGRLGPGVTAKDLMLHILLHFAKPQKTLDRVLEFGGPGLATLSMDERATLANMATECTARSGVCEGDEQTVRWICERRPGTPPADVRRKLVAPDPGAEYAGGVHAIDLATLEPMVAHPGDPDRGVPSDPTNGELVRKLGPVRIDIAYGGSCTAGKRDDVDMYAEVMAEARAAGRRVAPGVRFYIQFGSVDVERYARDRGYLDVFRDTGVEVIRPGCGACIGCGPGVSDRPDQVTVSAINRNYKGRSGPGRLYLASPLTVAASAVTGRITAWSRGLFARARADGRAEMSPAPRPAPAPAACDLLSALAGVALAPTSSAAADEACRAVVGLGGFGRAVYVAALPGGLVFGSAGLPPEERETLRAQMGLYGPVERSSNRFHALERHRFDADLDVAFVPAERRGQLPPVLLASPPGEGGPGERWESGDELVLLPHSQSGASLGTLALSAPADGRRPTAAATPALRTLLDFARGVGALLRAREQALEEGRVQARSVLEHVQSLTTLSDVNGLLDRIAEICARLAGYRVAVLTAHMEDGPHVGAWNLPADEREAFRRSSRGSTVESTAQKRARIGALAFPGTGISYVPHDVPLSRSKAFTPGQARPGGSWHPEDRLFVLLKTTQGRDIGVLSLDEPLDGRAPTVETLGALRVAERFLDLGGALLETRLLQAQVERTQRLEAVGTLVAGVAHDFNNLLGAIMGYASLLRVQLPESSELMPTARALEESCERAAGLTRRLRSLTQSTPADRRPLDIATLVIDVARTARDTFDPRLVVETDLGGGLPAVLGDEGALSRALLNLCINARDAQPEGGRITLRAREHPAEPGGGPRGVVIEVEDQGPGLSVHVRQHLFEPFFTTKARGKGTGLGLFGAWSAARAHGGILEAPEHGGSGALFRLRLPAAEAVSAAAASGGAAPRRGARVLVVEDESAMQDLIGRGVELLGHQVESAWDGQQAIEVLERRAAEFDLVLLDMLLPRRTGAEVFRALRAVRPELPVILSSGYVEEALMEPDIAAGVAATLPKPWTLPQLQETVQRVLSRRAVTP